MEPNNKVNQDTDDIQYDVMTPRVYIFGAAMILLGIIGVYMMWYKPHVYPLLTIFFYSIPSNCAISLFPHEPVLFMYGKSVNLWDLTIVATIGTVLAAYLDYKFFTPVMNLQFTASRYKTKPFYKTAYKWFYKCPFISLVVAGFTPIPFFPFKFMAYASKYSMTKYLLAVAVSRAPRYYLLAWAGYVFQFPNWVIWGSFLVMLGIVYFKKVLRWKNVPIALIVLIEIYFKVPAWIIISSFIVSFGAIYCREIFNGTKWLFAKFNSVFNGKRNLPAEN